MSEQFHPGDRVLHRREKDPRNYGTVMDISPMEQKPGWIAVYFQRKVWCKPENLRPLTETQKRQESLPQDIKNFWTRQSEEITK